MSGGAYRDPVWCARCTPARSSFVKQSVKYLKQNRIPVSNKIEADAFRHPKNRNPLPGFVQIKKGLSYNAAVCRLTAL